MNIEKYTKHIYYINIMLVLIFFIVSLFASSIGAVFGIGGGVIIKPILDSLNIMEVTKISFLSSCTVLSMSLYTFINSKLSKKSYKLKIIKKELG